MNSITKILFLLFAVSFAMLSCSPQRKMAVAFSKKTSELNALVIGPSFVFKTNQKKDILDSLKITDEAQFDSVLLANSLILQHIDDSLFISNYMLGYKKELSVFGFNVFDETDAGKFLESDSNSFVVNIAQLELEEVNYPWDDETQIYETKYTYSHDLNGIYINSWIEIGKLNDTTDKQQLYFASDLITDIVDGEFSFDIFSQEISYMFNYDSLKVSQLYDYAYVLGRTYAGYTFDLLLNKYLDANLPKDVRSTRYWRYDPAKRVFFPVEEDRFILMDQ